MIIQMKGCRTLVSSLSVALGLSMSGAVMGLSPAESPSVRQAAVVLTSSASPAGYRSDTMADRGVSESLVSNRGPMLSDGGDGQDGRDGLDCPFGGEGGSGGKAGQGYGNGQGGNGGRGGRGGLNSEGYASTGGDGGRGGNGYSGTNGGGGGKGGDGGNGGKAGWCDTIATIPAPAR